MPSSKAADKHVEGCRRTIGRTVLEVQLPGKLELSLLKPPASKRKVGMFAHHQLGPNPRLERPEGDRVESQRRVHPHFFCSLTHWGSSTGGASVASGSAAILLDNKDGTNSSRG